MQFGSLKKGQGPEPALTVGRGEEHGHVEEGQVLERGIAPVVGGVAVDVGQKGERSGYLLEQEDGVVLPVLVHLREPLHQLGKIAAEDTIVGVDLGEALED